MIDYTAVHDSFRNSNRVMSQRAQWPCDDPGAPPNTCRYCGKHWRKWAGSKLDGHSACMVTPEFKQELADMLRSPKVTFAMIADACGVSPSVVRSWVRADYRATLGGPL